MRRYHEGISSLVYKQSLKQFVFQEVIAGKIKVMWVTEIWHVIPLRIQEVMILELKWLAGICQIRKDVKDDILKKRVLHLLKCVGFIVLSTYLMISTMLQSKNERLSRQTYPDFRRTNYKKKKLDKRHCRNKYRVLEEF